MKSKNLQKTKVRATAAQERHVAGALFAVISDTGRVAASRMDHEGLNGALSAVDDNKDRLKRVLYHWILSSMNVGSKLVVDGYKAEEKAVANATRQALQFASRHSAKRVTQILAYNKKLIRRAVTSGLRAGHSNSKIAASIVKVTAGKIGKRRAQRIARTETHTAVEYGSYYRAVEDSKANGFSLSKTWQAVEDKRTRQAHHEADQQTVALDEPFIVGGERLLFPGDPKASGKNIINCRCVALYLPSLIKN